MSQEDPLEKEMATHSSILAWEIPEQRSLVGYSQSMGLQRVRHDLVTKEQGWSNSGFLSKTGEEDRSLYTPISRGQDINPANSRGSLSQARQMSRNSG